MLSANAYAWVADSFLLATVNGTSTNQLFTGLPLTAHRLLLELPIVGIRIFAILSLQIVGEMAIDNISNLR